MKTAATAVTKAAALASDTATTACTERERLYVKAWQVQTRGCALLAKGRHVQ